MSSKIIVYGHPFCPMVNPVLNMLESNEVEFDYINIHQDLEARERVRDINNGNESVPTLVFPDGSTLTEPNSGQLRAKLEEAGHTVAVDMSPPIFGNIPLLIVMGGIVLVVLLRAVGVI